MYKFGKPQYLILIDMSLPENISFKEKKEEKKTY